MLKIGFSGVNNPSKNIISSLSPLVKLIPVLSDSWPTVRWSVLPHFPLMVKWEFFLQGWGQMPFCKGLRKPFLQAKYYH